MATPGYAAGGVGVPTISVDATSLEQAAAALARLITGLGAYAAGEAGVAAAALQDEAARTLAWAEAQEIKVQGTDPGQHVAALLAIGGAGLTAAQHALADVQAMAAAAVGDLTDRIDDLDVARLLDDMTNLVNFYTTGYVHPCATVSHDILRVRTPQTYVPSTGEVPMPDELKVASLVGVPAGFTAILSDCLPDGFVSSDGGVEVNGQVVSRPVGMPSGTVGDGCDGCGGPGPSVFDNVNQRDEGRGTYGGPYQLSDGRRDGSNLYVTYRFYRPKARDNYGDTIIVWQSGTASIREHVNLKKFQTFISPEESNAARFEDYTPQGDREYESSAGVDIDLSFGLDPGASGGASVGVSVKRTINVEHTIFGGDLESDGRSVHAVRGGYRLIAQGHRNMSRAYSHAAAWTFPSGVSEMFHFWYDQYAYER